VILRHHPDRGLALRGVLVGIAAVLLVALLPADVSMIAQVGILVGLWLCLASLLVFAGGHWIRSQPPGTRSIPLRFSGSMGRFRLRTRGDGRHVEIVSDGVVLAEVKATDVRDEIELHEPVPSDELEELGSALGRAIEIVSDADEAHLDWDDHGASGELTDQPGSTRW
jgi:hypothetical protein